jgi:multiple sugar transport system ATP-binding protein
MAEITFEDVSKVFPDGTTAVDRLSLGVGDGEFLILVGPSGSGKSTALRMLAGLEEVSAGEVRIGERVVNDVAPKDRDIAMVFQSYALYPHMTVERNMGFALKMSGEPKGDIADRVGAVARKLGIGDLLARRPGQLSGGQRQRVALGRAIVRSPSAFLMDEPLSNLDAKLRVEMRAYIARLHDDLRATMVYVTHDQVEAMTMGDRVAVMRDGRLEQCDVPQVLYDRPANVFVAAFIGSPSMNLVEAQLSADAVSFGGYTLPLARDHRPRFAENGRVILGIRPEAFEDTNVAPGGLPRIDVQVEVLEELGSDSHIFFPVEAEQVLIDDALSDDPEDETSILASDRDRNLLVARVDARTDAHIGGTATLAVDPSRLYFFSPETGDSLLDASALSAV